MSSLFYESGKPLVVKPLGDLCTRMFVIDQATGLNDHIKKSLTIAWEQNEQCPVRYADLFAPSQRFAVIECDSSNDKGSGYGSTDFDQIQDSQMRDAAKAKALERDFDFRLYDQDFENWQRHGFECRWNSMGPNKTVYVASSLRFFGWRVDRAQQFHPTPELQSLIDTITKPLTDKVIGVYAKSGTVKTAALSDLLTILKEETGQPPLVVSDDANLLDEITSEYVSTRSLPSAKDLSSPEQQLIDMGCLSRTSQIIASNDDPFVQTAALINGLKLNVLGIA